MVNYKVGMIAAILAAVILAGSFASYAAMVPPTGGAAPVTVTRTETRTLEKTVTEVTTVERAVSPKLQKVTIGTLGAPSTSSWIVFVIEELKLDEKNGIDIEFVEQPSTSALYQDFRAGKYKISTGGTLTFANMFNQGVPIKIFLTYQLFGTAIIVNTERAPDIKSPKDLEGRVVAGSVAAENVRALLLYLSLLGVDINKIEMLNLEQSAAAAELRSPTGKAVAGILWAQLPSVLELENPNKFKILPGTSIPELERVWREKTGTDHHWLLAFAAWNDFIEENPELMQKIYDTFRDAVNFMRDFPDEMIKIVSQKTKIPENVLKDSVSKDRLKFLTKPIHTEKEALFKLYELSAQLGYIEKVPSEDIIYTGIRPA